jgi:CDP-glycerol glycerophosphotransferase (TagB/SpsB family)
VKPYACSHGKADEYFSEYSNIFFVNDEDINNDFYPLLPLTHLLITDYSSIFFDYVLLNKPIIFSPLEMPASERQFYYGYDRVTPGPKAENWNEVIEYIEEAVINPRKYEKERMVCRDTFNAFCDANSCNRIFRELEKISHRTGLL